MPRTLLAGVFGERPSALVELLDSWASLLGATVELAEVDRGSSAELPVTGTTGQLLLDRPDAERLAAELHTDVVPVALHLLAGTDPIAGLPALADRLPPPVLLAVDSQATDERVPHDVAYQLIRTSRRPVLAAIGTG